MLQLFEFNLLPTKSEKRCELLQLTCECKSIALPYKQLWMWIAISKIPFADFRASSLQNRSTEKSSEKAPDRLGCKTWSCNLLRDNKSVIAHWAVISRYNVSIRIQCISLNSNPIRRSPSWAINLYKFHLTTSRSHSFRLNIHISLHTISLAFILIVLKKSPTINHDIKVSLMLVRMNSLMKTRAANHKFSPSILKSS